jgi:hypothetical protein
METSLNITLLGVLSLGVFVGFILCLTLISSTNLTVKITASVISAALGGGPVVFMHGLTFEKWMYPIGLLLGLAWTRMISARNQSQGLGLVRLYAWLDILAIAGATLVIFVCATFVKFDPVHVKSQIANQAGSGDGSDWTNSEWNDARMNVSAIWLNNGLKNAYSQARVSGLSKFQSAIAAQAHNPKAQKTIIEFGEARYTNYIETLETPGK